MKNKLFFLLLIILPALVSAQKKKLTMEQAVMGLYTDLKIADLGQLQFMGSTDYYAYIHQQNGQDIIFFGNPITHNIEPYMTLLEFNELLVSKKEKEVKGFPSIHWLDEYSFYFQKGNTFYIVDNNKGERFEIRKLLELPEGAIPTAVGPNKKAVAYTYKNNLFIAKAGEVHTITTDGTDDIVYGEAVHRNEFGINDGSFWAPKGNALAFYRMDQSMVNNYPIVDWSVTPAVTKNIKYPMAGGTSHQVTIGVYHLDKKETIYLKTEGPKDQYLTSVSWSPDEKYVYVGILLRNQKELHFNKYDAKNGEFISTLFTDKNDKYVEPQHPLNFYSGKSSEFVWLSQRDGFMHIYHYENDQLKKQLTTGDWMVNDILGYNAQTDEIVFTSTKDGSMQQNIYAVKVSTSDIRKIGDVNAWHTPIVSSNGTSLLDKYRNSQTPHIIEVRSVAKGDMKKRLLTATNPLADYDMAKVKLVQLIGDNDMVFNGKLIYPCDFDSTKKYPCIIYTYNGPHVQLVKDGFPYSGNLWYDYMAQKGYFIYVMDGRGSSNRGFEFESATHNHLGVVEMQDQLKGVEFLKTLAYIDADRLGVHGWSFGGYMTTSLLVNYPDVFKCGVAGGPVMDWEMYEIMYTERYMETPATNKAGYEQTRLTEKADKLKNKLLLIHGAQDDVVVWQHSIKFLENAIKNNVQVDYTIYPSHQHNVRGKDRVHLMQKITDYFDLYLKP